MKSPLKFNKYRFLKETGIYYTNFILVCQGFHDQVKKLDYITLKLSHDLTRIMNH